MDSEQRFDDLIGLLYEASVNPDLWRPAIASLAELVGAHSFHMFTWDMHAQRPLLGMVSHDSLRERIALYDAYYHRVDPVLEQALRLPHGQMIASQEFFDDRFVGRSEYFQDFLMSNNQCWAAGGVVPVGEKVMAALALVRNHDSGRFSDDDLHRARRFWSHFGRATSLFVQTEELRQRAHLGVRGLEHVEFGVLATNDAGRVLFINRQAEAMILSSGRIAIHSGTLVGTDPTLDATVQSAISGAAQLSTCTSFPVNSAEGHPEELLITVAPLRESTPLWTVFARPSVLLLIRSRSRQRMLSVEQLMQLFRLTPAEARLARAIAQGVSPEEYASESDIAMPTVRTQLRSIFAKTAVHRQLDLVRLLVAIPPVRK